MTFCTEESGDESRGDEEEEVLRTDDDELVTPTMRCEKDRSNGDRDASFEMFNEPVTGEDLEMTGSNDISRDSLLFASSKNQPNQLTLKRGTSIASNISYHSLESSFGPGQRQNSQFAGGTLLPETEIWRIFADMARSIQHVHDKGFIHLDIKPTNFFVAKDKTVKLGDFGKAIHVDKIDQLIDNNVEGDSIYMAPELLNKKLSQKVDIFSLGATLLEIASSMNLPQNGFLWTKLRDGSRIMFSPSANRSYQLEDLINRMMSPHPEQRPPIEEILLHPNLQKHTTRRRNTNQAFSGNLHKSTSMVTEATEYRPLIATTADSENQNPNISSLYNSEAKHRRADNFLSNCQVIASVQDVDHEEEGSPEMVKKLSPSW